MNRQVSALGFVVPPQVGANAQPQQPPSGLSLWLVLAIAGGAGYMLYQESKPTRATGTVKTPAGFVKEWFAANGTVPSADMLEGYTEHTQWYKPASKWRGTTVGGHRIP